MTDLQKKYPSVIFPGCIKGVELARHMAGADVFVFPSLTDTFGVVILEANACGLPVAAHPVTGPGNVVIHGKTGWLSDDLRDTIHHALKIEPESCIAYARRFSWEKCTEEFLANLAVPARQG